MNIIKKIRNIIIVIMTLITFAYSITFADDISVYSDPYADVYDTQDAPTPGTAPHYNDTYPQDIPNYIHNSPRAIDQGEYYNDLDMDH